VPSFAIDFASYLESSSGLPQPQWDLIEAWAQQRVPPDDEFEFYTSAAREWLIALAEALDNEYYGTAESEHFLALAGEERMPLDVLVRGAEHCRRQLAELLPGVAQFSSPGKLAVLVLNGDDAYYAHVSHDHPEGDFGGSAGMHIRGFYPHVVLKECEASQLQVTMGHELMHAALMHLSLPLWVEEGLAQMFEHDVSGRALELDTREVRRQKNYWRRKGLEEFWSGEGFARPSKTQQHSYQLAEILMRLLLAEFRPRWFGFDHRAQERLMAFLSAAKASDSGQNAATEHLGFTLGELAARSLGAGEWEPGGEYGE
jgi:hypothetical protein